jgi:hypothetical protein
MNNFELDEKAKQYEDTMTPYALARRIIELEESQNKIKAEAVREAIDHADEFADDASNWIKLIKLCANKLGEI